MDNYGRGAGVVGVLVLVSGCAVIAGLDHTYKRDRDDDDEGDGGGPSCPPIEQRPKDLCSASPDWLNDVFPIFKTEGPKEASCTSQACHGGDPATAPRVYLPSTDAKASYDALAKYEGEQKYPYVNLGDPEHSWILCNLEDPPGVGQVMPAPPGALTPEELDVVKSWASCGMSYDNCDNGVKDTYEMYVDCGGTCPLDCPDGKGCGSDADCASGSSCWEGVCRSCMDNVKNWVESDVDCGEYCPNKCADGKMCGVNSDCQSSICVGGTCEPGMN